MKYRDEFKDKHDLDAFGTERSILRAWKPEWNEEKPYGFSWGHHFEQYLRLLLPEMDMHGFTLRQIQGVEECRYDNNLKILNVIGSKSSGKTNFMAAMAVAMVSIDPANTSCYVAAPYMSAADSTVWGEILVTVEAIKRASPLWDGIEVIKSKNRVVFEQHPKSGFIELRTLDKVGKLQGTKSVNADKGGLLLFCDEVAEFPTQALLDLLDNLTGNSNFFCLTGCNFSNTEGLEGKLCHPVGREYADLDIETDQSWLSGYKSYTVRLDGHRSPNIVLGKTKYRYLITQSAIDDAMEIHGANGPKYLEQIRSFPNNNMADYFVLSRERVRAGGGYDEFVHDRGKVTRVAACDPGFGGDPCKIGLFEYFTARVPDSAGVWQNVSIFAPVMAIQTIRVEANKVADEQWLGRLMKHGGGEFFNVLGQQVTIEMQIAVECAELVSSWGVEKRNFVFDGSMRAGIVQSMVGVMGNAIKGLDFGDRPSSKTGLTRGKDPKDIYGNYVSEMYFNFSSMVTSGQLRSAEMIPTAIVQICRRMWHVKGNKKYIETKEKYKKANRGVSPDDADVMVMGLEAALLSGFLSKPSSRVSSLINKFIKPIKLGSKSLSK